MASSTRAERGRPGGRSLVGGGSLVGGRSPVPDRSPASGRSPAGGRSLVGGRSPVADRSPAGGRSPSFSFLCRIVFIPTPTIIPHLEAACTSGSSERVGSAATRPLFAKAGHEVLVSFARDQARLEQLASEIGGRAGSPREAAEFGEVACCSRCRGSLIDDVLTDARPLAGKIVIDTTNQFGRDGWEDLGGRTAAQLNAARMPGAATPSRSTR